MGMSFRHNLVTYSFVLFAITLFVATPAMAADFYVAAGGVDYGASGPDSKSLTKSNGCSDSSSPCGSITHATALAKAGDVINLAAGLYSEGEAFPLFIRKGVTLQGAGAGKTIIEGKGVRALIVVEADSPDIDTKTIIRNIKIRGNFGGAGLAVGAGGGPMRNGLIKSDGGGMNEVAYATYYNSNGTVSNKTITGFTWLGPASYGVYVHADGSGNSANVSLLSNRISRNSTGVYVYVENYGVATVDFNNNTINDNYYNGVDVYAYDYGVANLNFNTNTIYSNSRAGVYLHARTTGYIYANFVNNNVSYNSRDGVNGYAEGGSGVVSMNMTGNTFYSNGRFGVRMDASSTGDSVNLYMKSNWVSYNGRAGVGLFIEGDAFGNLTMISNTVPSNNWAGVSVSISSSSGTVSAYLLNNNRGCPR